MKFRALCIGLSLCLCNASFAAEKTTFHIGVQASGTVDWEMTALQLAPTYESANFKVDVNRLANAEAGKIALQSGTVDMIVTDWIWVSKMRGSGVDFTFYPYSNSSGALIVPADSPIKKVTDLKGKRLGVAGGELDKNWLLLQALAQKEHLDLSKSVTKTFAAPPLINEQIKQNRVDAVLNYWNFAVKLEAQGYRKVLDGNDILKGLGISEPVPVIGFVFKQSWADKNRAGLNEFFAASKAAKNAICHDEPTWQKIIPLTQSDDAKTQARLRQGYCNGSVETWNEKSQLAEQELYTLLHKVSNKQLTGNAKTIQTGTFWSVQ